jgi:DNA-directed RNA polymerase subunit RPC12/RpoP
MRCPKCGSLILLSSKKDIYIVNEDGTFRISGIYGCTECGSVITYLLGEPEKKPSENVEKAKSAFGKIAKGCNNILNNITFK